MAKVAALDPVVPQSPKEPPPELDACQREKAKKLVDVYFGEDDLVIEGNALYIEMYDFHADGRWVDDTFAVSWNEQDTLIVRASDDGNFVLTMVLQKPYKDVTKSDISGADPTTKEKINKDLEDIAKHRAKGMRNGYRVKDKIYGCGKIKNPLQSCICLLHCCRCCFVLVVTILGLSLAYRLSGSQYYALVEDQETTAPYCRMILYNFREDGEEIGFSIGVADRNFSGTPDPINGSLSGITLPEISNESGYPLGNLYGVSSDGSDQDPLVVNFLAPKCPLQITKVGSTKDATATFNRRVLAHNMETRQQLEMPDYCGGAKPGEFLDKLRADTDKLNGGVWVTPIVMSLFLWWFLRSLLVLVAAVKPAIVKPPDGSSWVKKKARFIYSIVMPWFLNTICCGFFIAPLQNIEFHDLSPQIVLTYYSGVLQMGLFVASSALMVVIGVIIVSLLHGCCACLAPSLPEEQMKVFNDNEKIIRRLQAYKCFFRLILGGLCAGGPVFAGGGAWYLADRAWWGIFFGMVINVNWYYPDMNLAMSVNVFHSLTAVLWASDTLTTVLDLKKFCRKAVEWAQD